MPVKEFQSVEIGLIQIAFAAMVIWLATNWTAYND